MMRLLVRFVAAGVVMTACAPMSPVPSPLATTVGPAMRSPTPAPTGRSDPMSMDAVRAAYEAQGLECREYEPISPGEWGVGTALGCETMVGTGQLLIEAPYSTDGDLLRLISQLIVLPPRDTAIGPRDSERAVEIVLAIDYSGHDREATAEQLQEWVRVGCDRRCEVPTAVGRWDLVTRDVGSGWILRLWLDDDPPLR